MTGKKAADRHREIIVFDGVCVLCTANARFVLMYDHDRHFALAAMQGATGSEIYRKAGIDPNNPETLVVLTPNGLKRESDAVLHIYGRWLAMAGCGRISDRPTAAPRCGLSADRAKPLSPVRPA